MVMLMGGWQTALMLTNAISVSVKERCCSCVSVKAERDHRGEGSAMCIVSARSTEATNRLDTRENAP